MNREPLFHEQWLVDTCSTEIRFHRLMFFFVLCPLLGLWLPYQMFFVGLSVLIQAQASVTGTEVGDESPWTLVAIAVSVVIPLSAASIGLIRESRRQVAADKAALAGGMRLPVRQGAFLTSQLQLIWDKLKGKAFELPRVICRPTFAVLAHAYDIGDGQTIEVSAGLASRVVQADPLARAILRHEIAHLVYGDLRAVRRQSLAAAGSILSLNAALLICIVATLAIVAVTDLGTFPKPVTLANIISVHLTIFLGAILVILPLLLGRFIIRRYAGFNISLIETRADVCAGISGEGLQDFSSHLLNDPTIRPTTMRDVGLAYISPSLSHLPTRERATMLSDPSRLATPKLRYFAVAIGIIWLLSFHQGTRVWDSFLLSASVAFLQALTVQMLLVARERLHLSLKRALTLGAGLLAAQALPLISIEGLAYLSQHLTAAIVRPGGFGSAEDADYIRDIIVTFQEFGRFVVRATGGFGFLISVVVTAMCYWLISWLPAETAGRPMRYRTILVSATAFVVSITMSYKFFQEFLCRNVRDAAFAFPGSNGTFWTRLPPAFQQWLSKAIWGFSDFLHGPPFLESYPWIRLALPIVSALLVAVFAFGKPRCGKHVSVLTKV